MVTDLLYTAAQFSTWPPSRASVRPFSTVKAAGSLRVTVRSLWDSSVDCLVTMGSRESWRPKPMSSRAVQPATPSTVIKNRFLYRNLIRYKNRFRAVVFWEKLMRFHRGVMYSRKMRLPATGARGSSRAALFSFRLERQALQVARPMTAALMAMLAAAMPG